ncbi:MAG: cysteine desulfurase family protein [Gammaproteobacteria bacterium]|nr:cysteine desulfurase family protein [Gammaproteobacteria bacterium]
MGIFLDFQATTPLDPIVLEKMLPWMSGAWNAHAVEHRPGRAAAAAVEHAREQVAVLLGCEPTEITFTSGATEASNIVMRGATDPGDELVISAIEHASVMETANALEAEGRVVHRIGVSEDGLLDLGLLQAALSSQPALVSIMAVNNEIGTLQPVKEAAGICAECGVLLHSDLTQAVGRIPVALSGLPLSYASISSHKIYGPQGIGALFVGAGAPVPRPLTTGGGQENGLRPGTLPVAACVGFGAACELALANRERDHEHASSLSRAMLDELSGLAGWQVNGSLEERIPHNLSLAFDGVEAEALLGSLPELALATGSACSSGAVRGSATLRAIGLPDDLANGTVRIGFGRTTTLDEVRTAAGLLCDRVRWLRRHAA